MQMKMLRYRLAASLLALLPFAALAQDALPVDPETGKITYAGVVRLEGTAQQELFRRAKTWADTRIQNARELPVDSANSQLARLGVMPRNIKASLGGKLTVGQVQYQLSIQCREGRYRYELIPFLYERFADRKITDRIPLPLNVEGKLSKVDRDMLEDVHQMIQAYAAELQEHMAAKPPVQPAADTTKKAPAKPKDW